MTLRYFAAAASLCMMASSASSAPFDRAMWKADYQRLKSALAQGYANLDWVVEKRGLNLVRADGQIDAMLDKVDSDAGATLVFAKLVAAFDDPHLELKPGSPPAGASLPMASRLDGPTPAADVCAAERYAPAKSATRLPYPQAPEWKSVATGHFPAGTIGDIGVLRIADFSETRYLDACAAVAKPGLAGRDLQLAVRAELNRQLAATVRTLKQAGARRLVIDLSRNGGGSEWSTEAITLFTAGRLIRQEPRRVGPACDRSGIWKSEKPACSVYAGSPATEWVESDGPPPWTGPLAIIADRHTASAAEEFITWARDNGRATLGGEKTMGSGCGFIDGGNAFAFRAAPIHLMMPNCSRFTRDGVNEIEGQTPDVAIDWQKLRPAETASTLEKLFPTSANDAP